MRWKIDQRDRLELVHDLDSGIKILGKTKKIARVVVSSKMFLFINLVSCSAKKEERTLFSCTKLTSPLIKPQNEL